MRIAHLITRMIVGGAQENTLYNCLDLQEQFDDQVVLITGPTEGPEGRLLEQGRGRGLQVIEIPSLRRSIHPLRDALAYRQLLRALREFQPEVVHTHSAKAGLLGRAAAWSLPDLSSPRQNHSPRLPRHQRPPLVIHTVHGAPFHRYQSAAARNFFIACERWAAKRCHHMICVAQAMTDTLVQANVAPASAFTTIYSGMEIEPFLEAKIHRESMRQRLGFHPQDIVVGKVARLFHLKGHSLLIEAARIAVQSQPQLKFLLMGDGILKSELESQIDAPEQMPQYLSVCDLLVHCSLREGLARALPQALLCGIPAVSFDIDGAREVVFDRVTGRLIAAEDVPRLAEAIVELAQRPDLRESWGNEGKIRCARQFDHRQMTAQIRSLYQRWLDRLGYPTASSPLGKK
jgi:glycosyltransferase involved in cell wall biosynthesis